MKSIAIDNNNSNNNDIINSFSQKTIDNNNIFTNSNEYKQDDDNENNYNNDNILIEEEKWISGFMDLIYAGVIYNIDCFIHNCGESVFSYLMSISYFLIMFSSRKLIDIYYISFVESDNDSILQRTVLFAYSLGVFMMTLNISTELIDKNNHPYRPRLDDTPEGVIITYGNCMQNFAYNNTFASFFILTRSILIILYVIMLYNGSQLQKISNINIKQNLNKLLYELFSNQN
jgi:hypothetical protein